MKLMYIYHSGFIIEMNECNLVFDYYKGDMENTNKDKKTYVFSSHAHRDHFNEDIFDLFKECKDVEYVLSDDISYKANGDEKITYVSPNNTYDIGCLNIETLTSTDEGVAFIVNVEGKSIYHSGDLNWWTWHGYETEEEYETMTKRYHNEIEKIKGRSFDLSMAVLDPRQERYDWGIKYLLENMSTRYLCPMHLWDKYEYVDRFKKENSNIIKDIIIINPADIEQEGYDWE